MEKATCDIGLVGLAVMGQNLVLNMNDHGFKVAVFNRTVSKVDDFLAHEAKGTQVVGAHSMEEFVAALKSPRRVMFMVKAGDTVDQMIENISSPYVSVAEQRRQLDLIHQLNELLAARDLPVIGGLIGDFEDFMQRTKQGRGP